MITDWERSPHDIQLVLSSEALKRARLIVGAQAQMLADRMDRGFLPAFDGPDALRLLAMILNQDDTPSHHEHSYGSAELHAPALA